MESRGLGWKGKEHYIYDRNHTAATVLILTQLLWQLHYGDTWALIVLVKHWVAMQNVKVEIVPSD